MSFNDRIKKSFDNACRLPLSEKSRYVVFSDCHRGTGKANDNFLKNENIYMAALQYYYTRGFTYIELGDGDELWENRSFEDIKEMHWRVFDTLARYYRENRFVGIYGNHDMVKRSERFVGRNMSEYYCENAMCSHELFPDATFYPAAILEDNLNRKNIYLTHGHQADVLNSTLWRVSRFLVRYLWQPLEDLGMPDPTSAAKNNTKKKKSEQRLTEWAQINKNILITGHTHHPMVGTPTSPYFNTGSCVSLSGITCIEIEKRCLTLYKWSYSTRQDMTVYVAKSVLGERVCIDEY